MENRPQAIDLLIFDLDGTLVNTLQDIANALNYSLTRLGKTELPVEKIKQYVGEGFRKFLERAISTPTDSEVEQGLAFFRGYYAEHICDFADTYPGIPEILQHFASRKKAVLTNKPEDFAVPILQRLQIKDHFDVIVGSKTGFKHKPEPDGVLQIIERLNVSPRKTVIIGDSESDIAAGKAAGIYTCAVHYGFRSAETLRAFHPDFEISKPVELKDVFI